MDVQAFIEFLLRVVQSSSLIVSIPVLVTWTRLLNNRSIGSSIANTHLVGPLLELCSSRLIRYENLPQDTPDPSYLFLLEDTDTIPERHAFLGNYRRYGCQVIETIVQLKLVDAFHHILGQTENVLQHLYDGQPPLDGTYLPRPRHPCLPNRGIISVELQQELDAGAASRCPLYRHRIGAQRIPQVESDLDARVHRC